MNMRSGINTGFLLCDDSDSKSEVEDAGISPTLSHTEVPKLQNISRIAESIKMQEDFLTSIHEGVSGHFPDLSFAMSCASVNSDITNLKRKVRKVSTNSFINASTEIFLRF